MDDFVLQTAQVADVFHALGLAWAAGTHQRYPGTLDRRADGERSLDDNVRFIDVYRL